MQCCLWNQFVFGEYGNFLNFQKRDTKLDALHFWPKNNINDLFFRFHNTRTATTPVAVLA